MRNPRLRSRANVYDHRFLGRIVLLSVLVLSSGSCATRGPVRFSGSTIRHLNPQAPSLKKMETSINVRWNPGDATVDDHESLSQHTGEFTYSFLSNVTEPMRGGVDPRAAVFVPVIWAGAAISGAAYGAVGHIFSPTGKTPEFPEGLHPGEMFLCQVLGDCRAYGRHRTGIDGFHQRTVNLDLRLLHEGLSLQDGRFNQFYFEIVVHARLTDEQRDRTLADLLIREFSTSRKMSDWEEITEDQWAMWITDMEGRLARRLATELRLVLAN